MKCNLPEDVNSCPMFQKDNATCKNQNKCSYQVSEEVIKEKYVRQERWYEKYYRKK